MKVIDKLSTKELEKMERTLESARYDYLIGSLQSKLYKFEEQLEMTIEQVEEKLDVVMNWNKLTGLPEGKTAIEDFKEYRGKLLDAISTIRDLQRTGDACIHFHNSLLELEDKVYRIISNRKNGGDYQR